MWSIHLSMKLESDVMSEMPDAHYSLAVVNSAHLCFKHYSNVWG